jgi:hypothetical protein
MGEDSPRHHRIYCLPWLTWAQEGDLWAAAALLPPVGARGKKMSRRWCARSGSGVESPAARARSVGRRRGRRPPSPSQEQACGQGGAATDDPSRTNLELERD